MLQKVWSTNCRISKNQIRFSQMFFYLFQCEIQIYWSEYLLLIQCYKHPLKEERRAAAKNTSTNFEAFKMAQHQNSVARSVTNSEAEILNN